MGAITYHRKLQYTESITSELAPNAASASRCDSHRGPRPPHEAQQKPEAPPHDSAFDIFPDKTVNELTAKELGKLGEDLAAQYLCDAGMEILEQNYRCREGEADIVAADADEGCVVLAEVKTRRGASVGDGTYAEEAVNEKKRKRYRRIAACYLMDNFPVPSIRFDVLAVTVFPDRTYEVHHVPGAYDWDAER